jgi:hypothetical protein
LSLQHPIPPKTVLTASNVRWRIEKSLINRIQGDPILAPDERQRLIREVEARIERAEFGDEDDFGDDDFAALVRKIGPRSPRGQSGATAVPNPPFPD